MKRILFAALLALGLSSLAAGPVVKAHLHPQIRILTARAQVGGVCGSGVQHCTVLTWVASPSAANCSLTGTPPCSFFYNVFEGTTAGGESTTPVNTSPITGNTFIVPVTLTNNQQTFFYTVGAGATVTETGGTVTAFSLTNSNEVSVTFPGTPAPPTGAAGSPH